MSQQPKEIGKEWLVARDIIANSLREWGFVHRGPTEDYAAAILARLANNDPPIITEMQDGKRSYWGGNRMTREQMKEVADASWGQDKPVTAPGIDALRLEWLLRCEAAIKSMAAQFVCPKTTPEQMVNMILKGDQK